MFDSYHVFSSLTILYGWYDNYINQSRENQNDRHNNKELKIDQALDKVYYKKYSYASPYVIKTIPMKMNVNDSKVYPSPW